MAMQRAHDELEEIGARAPHRTVLLHARPRLARRT
jgi:hypothetical protein